MSSPLYWQHHDISSIKYTCPRFWLLAIITAASANSLLERRKHMFQINLNAQEINLHYQHFLRSVQWQLL